MTDMKDEIARHIARLCFLFTLPKLSFKKSGIKILIVFGK